MKYPKTLALILMLTANGCATNPLSQEDARGIPESRVRQKSLLERRDGRIEIVFIREEATIRGILSSADIFINSAPLASLAHGEKFSIWVEPDLYVFAVTHSQLGHGYLAFSEKQLSTTALKVEVEARVGRRYEVRIDFTNWAVVPIKASSSPIASNTPEQ